jgi:hypothetical protein
MLRGRKNKVFVNEKRLKEIVAMNNDDLINSIFKQGHQAD